VLIPDSYNDPVGIVERALANRGVSGDPHFSDPTLEDVFVAVTMKPEENGE
jgi:hypothetical protein